MFHSCHASKRTKAFTQMQKNTDILEASMSKLKEKKSVSRTKVQVIDIVYCYGKYLVSERKPIAAVSAARSVSEVKGP